MGDPLEELQESNLKLDEAVKALGVFPMFAEGDSSYEGPGGIEQKPEELIAFTQLLRQKARRESYLELGIGYGGLLRFLKEQVPFRRAVGVDLFVAWSNEERARLNLQACGASLVQGDLRDPDMPDRILRAGEGELFDVVFVDGDHGESSVFEDACLAAKVVADDGWICFHDYVHPTTTGAVTSAVQRFLATPQGQRFTVSQVIGESYGIAILVPRLT